MREDRLNELKRIFLKIYYKDDTVNYTKLIYELMSFWTISRYDVIEMLNALEKDNFIKVLKMPKISYAWLNDEDEKVKIILKNENQATLYY